MATKLDELQSPLLSKTGLDKLLVLLKNYLDNFAPSTEALEHINERIDTLVGQKEDGTVVDVTTAIDTFNEIKDFLSGIEDTDLQSLLTAINNAVTAEATRAGNAETALGNRISTLENLDVMTAAEVNAAWNAVFQSQP